MVSTVSAPFQKKDEGDVANSAEKALRVAVRSIAVLKVMTIAPSLATPVAPEDGAADTIVGPSGTTASVPVSGWEATSSPLASVGALGASDFGAAASRVSELEPSWLDAASPVGLGALWSGRAPSSRSC